MTLDETPRRLRWPRSHRFVLSESGRAAELEYRADIVAARSAPGRQSFDAARAAWAAKHGLSVDDGLYLGELAREPSTLAQVVAALESSGKNRADAIAAFDRLADANMLASSSG